MHPESVSYIAETVSEHKIFLHLFTFFLPLASPLLLLFPSMSASNVSIGDKLKRAGSWKKLLCKG